MISKLTLIFATLWIGILQAQIMLEYDIDTINTPIAVPLAGTVNVSVDWGDGTTGSYNTGGSKTHTYTNIGTKVVTITGSLTQFGSSSANNSRLVKVTSWDGVGLTSLSGAFYNASLLTNVPSSLPNTVTDLSGMFAGATSFNQPINSWDVSMVTDMRSMFNNAYGFNQAIGAWDVSKVTNMNSMFFGASSFNHPIGSWDVSQVTDMGYMFYNDISFNQDIGKWDVSKVTNMEYMFYNLFLFNQPLGTWQVSNVTNMNGMFYNATSFNQAIDTWDVSNVRDMGTMFHNASSFNQPIGTWDTKKVTNMISMFFGATSFNQTIGTWDVSNVTDMGYMFSGATSFNEAIGTWDVSKVTNMFNIFYGITLCTSIYDAILNGWATQNVLTGLEFTGGNSKYSSAAATARANLISSKSWYITDGGLDTASKPTCMAWTHIPPNDSCGTVLNFNGEGKYVSVPYSQENNSLKFSYAFWARPQAQYSPFPALLASRDFTNNGNRLIGYSVNIRDNSNWEWLVGVGSNYWKTVQGPVIDINKWTHIACSYDGSIFKFYIDGIIVGSLNTIYYSPNLTQELRIGAGETETENPLYHFRGQLDEVSVWSRTITDSEIEHLMNGNWSDLSQDSLSSYWNFNDGVYKSSVLKDMTPNQNHGTLHNMDIEKDWTLSNGSLIPNSCYTITDLADTELMPSVEIYPNPNDGSFFLNVPITNNEKFTIRIYNALGEDVKALSFTDMNFAKVTYQGSPGIYWLEMITNTGKSTKQKIVKK